MADINLPQNLAPVTVFAASWCPHSQRLVSDLRSNDTEFILIDPDGEGTELHGFESLEQVNDWIKSVNNGNRVVPTVLFSDGEHMTNPPAADVVSKLQQL